MSDQRIPISQLSETQTAPDASYIAIDDGSLTKKITVENFNSTSTASAQQYANQAAASAQTVEDNIATSAAQIREATLAAREATQASTAASASATSAYDSASLAQNYSANASTSAGQAMNAADSAAQNLTASKGYAEDSEAWAVGKRNGSDVPASDETYQNNAKYYANSASGSATRAETAAQSINVPDTTLTVSGVAADSKATGDRISSVNVELVDIRVMTNGKTAATAGDAVREQITNLSAEFNYNIQASGATERPSFYNYFSFEEGRINGTTGEDVSSTSQCRLKGRAALPVGSRLLFETDVNLTIGYIYKYSASGAYLGYTQITLRTNSENIYTTESPYIRLAFVYNSVITTPALVEAHITITTKTVIDEINSSLDEVSGKVEDLIEAKNISSLYIGEMINAHVTAQGLADDDLAPYRLSSVNVVAFPFTLKRELTIKINDGFVCALFYGARGSNLDANQSWLGNGAKITVPKGYNYYRFSIAVDDGTSGKRTAISPTDDIGFEVTYESTPTVVNMTDEGQKMLSASRLYFSPTDPNTLSRYAVIAHTSDCHGDRERVKRFMDFCDYVKADYGAITGDIVADNPSNSLDWFVELIGSVKTTMGVCVGNHEVMHTNPTDSEVYDLLYSDIASSIGNLTGKTWYFTDLSDKKIRVISVNQFEAGAANRTTTHLSNEQLSWLCSTLLSTPADYGVLIMHHVPETALTNAKDMSYDEFFQDTRKYDSIISGITGTPIYDIIDAFIGRTSISKTYVQTGEPASVSVSADFSGINSGVEFIAHMTGHFHQDSVCYVPGTTNKQLMLNIICTVAVYGGAAYPYLSDLSDLPRNGGDTTQDAFNAYIIDRDNKIVKIVRIGSDLTYEMSERKHLAIPYAE